jgi:transcriptional regulator with XRE-family HTH domain
VYNYNAVVVAYVMAVIINLKKARDEKGMSLNDLARASGLSPQYLSKLENNLQGTQDGLRPS